MDIQWQQLKVNNTKVLSLSNALEIDQVLARLLVLRGIDTFEKAKVFFRPSTQHLHDPFMMKGMQKAVDRIEQAIITGQKIMVYGDYDVDGSTAVSLVFSFLKQHSTQIIYYIPDRYKEGYGLSFMGIEKAKEEGCTLLITLDCGIKAVDKVNKANSLGIDVIICDHHHPPETLPAAYAILNPKQANCTYPYKELSGCGVGYKLCKAIESKIDSPEIPADSLLDLVAVSTACDIVPLTGENRVLVHFGLQKLNTKANKGLTGLLHTSKRNTQKPLSVEDLVFKLGPRINAAGRIAHASKAVDLLINQDLKTAHILAENINEHNQERRALDQKTTLEALDTIHNDPELKSAKTTVLYAEHWHKGVIGIVASRLIESYYRPTIVFTKSGKKAAGSARSVKGYNVYQAIEACSEVLEQFGGHKYAAGLTIKPENIPVFKQQFEAFVHRTILPEQCTPVLDIDAEIEFEKITPKFLRILKQMAPFGPENMKPVFITTGVIDTGYSKCVGADNSHVKFSLTQENAQGIIFSGIGFSMGRHFEYITSGKPFDIVYTLEENYWNGSVNTQLMIKDIHY